ncbi:MAG: UDP-N-acetylmuramoylalanine--D-glutamate ligase [Firmicutes bacterium ADurb.Bin182]|nr:MAG: UDP-N-acetylmuramoylalanine--D-glutamate ligase [Firmicutes bacterium ADurb.Bin182]
MNGNTKKNALVVGMARSGISSAKLLYKNGWNVIINDIKRDIPGLLEQLSGIEYTDALGIDPKELIFGIDLLVLSPVIPIFAPFAKEAAERGVEVIGEIELGYRYSKGKFICVSGTNGKTTATALTGEMFRKGDFNTFVLGNIGIPIAEKAMETKPGDVIVAEVAALQLESIKKFHAHAAAMLNITEDHLNRFEESMDKYIAAKCRLFENQTCDDFAVLNYDDPTVRKMSELTSAKVLYFSRKEQPEEGVFIRDDTIIWRYEGKELDVLKTNEIQIPGLHNLENALACTALALSSKVPLGAVQKALKEFPGVEHRIEFVCEHEGVQYINDSKGTNPDSTIKAVEAMKRPTILLLGVGEYDKHSDFLPLFNAFGGKVKAVLASGVNVPAIKESADKAGFTNLFECREGLREMVGLAKCLAEPGDTVLLSPAAASWGIYSDFEERGRHFKQIVHEICRTE